MWPQKTGPESSIIRIEEELWRCVVASWSIQQWNHSARAPGKPGARGHRHELSPSTRLQVSVDPAITNCSAMQVQAVVTV